MNRTYTDGSRASSFAAVFSSSVRSNNTTGFKADIELYQVRGHLP